MAIFVKINLFFMDIEGLKTRLQALAVWVEKSRQPTENLVDGVSAGDVKLLWSDYNTLLRDFKRHSDLFGEYREVPVPQTRELEAKYTPPITGYSFESLKPLARQIEALKALIEQNYL